MTKEFVVWDVKNQHKETEDPFLIDSSLSNGIGQNLRKRIWINKNLKIPIKQKKGAELQQSINHLSTLYTYIQYNHRSLYPLYSLKTKNS